MPDGNGYNFDRLLDLAHDKSDYSQAEIADFAAEILMKAPAETQGQERALAQDILSQLLEEAAVALRATVARKFAPNPFIPKDLILFLAEDASFEVAQPVLMQSELLADDDLLDIIERQNRLRALAIATRAHLSDTVGCALVSLEDEGVSLTLAQNRKSDFGTVTLEELAAQAIEFESLQKPLTLRSDLPAMLAAKLYWWVGQDLRKEIIERFEVSPALLDDTLELAMQKLVDHHSDPKALSQSQKNYAEQLYLVGSITPELLIYVLRQGQTALFVHFFSRLTGLSVSVLKDVLSEKGIEAFTILCRSLDVSKPNFATLFLLSRSAREGEHMVDPSELGKVMALYDRISIKQAKSICKGWQADDQNLYRVIERKNWEA